MSEEIPDPQLPPPGNGNGGPPPVRLTRISPIAGSLVGGITATLNGRSFQPGAEVYFGSTPSPTVTFINSISVQAVVPAATQPGTVPVTLVNPDGEEATLQSGFTYLTSEASLHAEVLGVAPLSVLEDTETEVTVRGRNLISANTDGLVALRGTTRVNVSILNLATSHDAETGIEELIFTVRITAAPPLGSMERVTIQVLASLRPGAASDGVFESSRQMFIVLPRALPVTLAFTDTLTSDRPNLVVISGRNLEGCWLDFGEGVTVHMQQSEDRAITGIVTLTDTQSSGRSEALTSRGDSQPLTPAVPRQLSVRNVSGDEVAQLELSVVSADGIDTIEAKPPSTDVSNEPSEPNEMSLSLAPVPDQQMIAPTEDDSRIFKLRDGTVSSLIFDWTAFVFDIFDLDFNFVIVNEVRLIPFFDGGGPFKSPVLAEVGKMLRLRGAGLLLALRIEIIVQIRVAIIIGYRFNIGFNPFNEFGDIFSWGIGSIIISIRVIIRFRFFFSSLVALVRPDGSLNVLFHSTLVIDIDFRLESDGHSISFDPDFQIHYRVNVVGVGPVLSNLLPCNGRFQLVTANGQSAFFDSQGGSQSFYFARDTGSCCLQWNFNLELVRFTSGQPPVTLQQGFRTEFCLAAAPSADLRVIIVTSENPSPEGIPPTLTLDVEQSAPLIALIRPMDNQGNLGPFQDARDLGYDVAFILEFPSDQVLDSDSLLFGVAFAQLPGDNVINAVLTPRPNQTPQFGFWPSSILGFTTGHALAEGEMPSFVGGALPVSVNAKITVEPTLAYRDDSGQLQTAPTVATQLPSSQTVFELERSEPFETQPLAQQPREYVLAFKVKDITGLRSAKTIDVNVTEVKMLLLDSNKSVPDMYKAPLEGTGYRRGRDIETSIGKFFTGKLVEVQSQTTIRVTIPVQTQPNGLIEIADPTTRLNIWPNNREEVDPHSTATPPALAKFVPPGKRVASKMVGTTEVHRHVLLSVKMTARGHGVSVTLTPPPLMMAVRNDETFEEYLRVFAEAQDVLAGTDPAIVKYRDFAKNFFATLKTKHDNKTLNDEGDDLWKHAYTTVQSSLQDDRQLYIARLQSIGALRAFGKRAGLSEADTEALIVLFERPSRGLDQSTGKISVADAPPGARRAVVTGFDPFGLTATPDLSNPSGLVALALNKKTFSTNQPLVYIRTAIFPVRYKEFDAAWVENAASDDLLNQIVMLMTCSENRGRDIYDIERWAGKNRVTATDNNRKEGTGAAITVTTGTPPVTTTVSGLVDPIGNLTGADQFLQSTLPYLKVITDNLTTRRLRGPSESRPDTMPFVTDQSYLTIVRTTSTQTPGEFRDEPPDEMGTDAYERQTDIPDNNKKANSGSGGSYLSNEIFYRMALRRVSKQPNLASGHFHLPGFVTPSSSNTAASQRQRLIEGTSNAIERFLRYSFRLTAQIPNVTNPEAIFDLSFPDTVVNRPSAQVQLKIVNGATDPSVAPIKISAIEATPPFTVQSPTPLPSPQTPINLPPNSSVTLSLAFTPTTVGDNTGTLTLREPGGEVLLKVALTGKGTPVFSITGQVTVGGTTTPGSLQGVQVTLSGSRTGSATTGTDGRYSFTDLPGGGNYTITPSKRNYTFSPPSATFNNLGANSTADFVATLNRYRIRGRVKTASGTGVPGTVVTLSGSQSASTTTDAAGNYSFDNLPASGNYTVTIGRANYSFTPATQAFNDLSADMDFDFTGTLATYTISGRVTCGGVGFGGVTINLGGSQTASTMTDAAGNYSFANIPAEGNYSATPTLAGYTFTPASRAFNGLNADQVADFAAAPNRINVALSANGATASASSTYSGFAPGGVINGDRKGVGVAHDGYWSTATGGFPAWLQIDFSGSKTIDEIDVFTIQDNYANPSEPTPQMTFSQYGVQSYDVQYWDGSAWQVVPGGSVSGNNLVWRKFTFSPITTTKIRVLTKASPDNFSRLTEVEAYEVPLPRINVAFSANGATASASSAFSGFAPSGVINGDRKGLGVSHDGYWSTATAGFPAWLEIDFAGISTIYEIDVFTIQDNYANPSEPTTTMTFSIAGLQGYEVQYWTGSAWATIPGGSVSGNNMVWRRFTFSPIKTSKIRVLTNASPDGYSRLAEVEVYGAPAQPRINVALSANGATASASSAFSGFAPSGVINGDRKGLGVSHDGYWSTATAGFPAWLEIDFSGSKTIDEIDVFTIQDNYTNPSEPTPQMTFSQNGVQSYDVQYWDGSAWQVVPGGSVSGNNLVWRKFTFSPITTTKIRVLTKASPDNFSRLTEVEAWSVNL